MTDETTGESKEDKAFAAFKQKASMELVERALGFFGKDESIIGAVDDIFGTIARSLKANEVNLFKNTSGTKIDLDALRAAFKARSEDVGPSDIAGSDIDLGWLRDLGSFIHDVGDFIKFEKKTFLAILLLIFCKDCECVCKFINQPECCDDVAGGK